MATGSKQASPLPSLHPNFEVIDESFSPEAKAGYHLSILAGTDQLACSVLDIQANKFIAIQELQFENDDSFKSTCDLLKQQGSDSFYSGEYSSVTAALVHPLSTLIPVPLFDPESSDNYLQFNHGKDVGTAAHDLIPETDAQNVYALPENIDAIIKRAFPNVQVCHFSTTLLESLLVQHKNSTEQQIFVHLLPTRLCVTVLNEGKLILYNTYPHKTKEDVVYYILFVMEQLKLNAEKIPLSLYGEIQKSSEVFKLLEKYVKDVQFGSRPKNINYSLKFQEIPGHYYYNLFNHFFLF